MSMYRTPIVVGDRVALAPHVDLWMAGTRFGTVTNIGIADTDRDRVLFYNVRLDTGRHVTLDHDDLMGAVAGTPVGGGSQPATRSTEPLVEAMRQGMTVYADELNTEPDEADSLVEAMRQGTYCGVEYGEAREGECECARCSKAFPDPLQDWPMPGYLRVIPSEGGTEL